MTASPILRLISTCLPVLLLACGSSAEGPGEPPPPTPTPTPPLPLPIEPLPPGTVPTLSRATLMTGLNAPWDIAFTPDGSMLFTEKCRGLSVRFADGTVVALFTNSGSALVAADLTCAGQAGALGVAVDPAFATNRRVYVFLGSTLGTPRSNRVVRLVLAADLRSASQRSDIITDIPYKNLATANGSAGVHNGGRLRFGPDGFLYVTTGDNHSGTLPQSPTLLGGKVLRVTTDGAAAAGNNAPSNYDRRIYTYGHRNVQGLSFRPGTGQPFVGEHGPNHSDEVTPLQNGGNAGWDPQNRPGLNCLDNYCGYSGTATTMPMTDLTRFPQAMRPSWSNNGASQGIGPVEFLRGTQWGAWNGRLAVGIMGGTRLDILELDTSGISLGTTASGLPGTRFRGLTQGPDGSLYVATDAGEIWRVTPGR